MELSVIISLVNVNASLVSPGDSCLDICSDNTYGLNCTETCECKNGAKCSNVDGKCNRAPGCKGKLCEDGFWGPKCENSCEYLKEKNRHVSSLESKKQDNVFAQQVGKDNNVTGHAAMTYMVHNVIVYVFVIMEHLVTLRTVTVHAVQASLDNVENINANQATLAIILNK
ncbi:hypothetical protein WA026_010110 [Henosepilachna vigintioctopunctata]|uniref:Uncharacterized protein n=1 Tax=Henosepilachna vigintioctopunctata TaxID=420089 RepID=A0AAW1UHC0_9CUCU